MVMVDSSVWIDVFRRRATPEVNALWQMAADGAACTADLCLFEILQGVKPEAAFQKTYERLSVFTIVPVGGQLVCVQSARYAQLLRARGVQPGAVDCLLATYCIMNGVGLLTTDKGFEPFAQHLGLHLVR